MLERARKAEAEAAALKTQLKTETTTSKKALKEMEAALTESTALSQKSEREYVTLRDSVKGLVESFKVDTERLRGEMKKREERWREEAASAGRKYGKLVQEIAGVEGERGKIKELKEQDRRHGGEVEKVWLEEIEVLKERVAKSSKESDEAKKTAKLVFSWFVCHCGLN